MSRSVFRSPQALLVCLVGACATPLAPRPLAQVPYEAPLVPVLPTVLVAMPGDPDDRELAGARLTERTCSEGDQQTKDRADRLRQEMRAAVDASYEEWREIAGERCYWGRRGGGVMRAPMIGESFGAGGLGLSGGGVGGGGTGAPAPAKSASKTNTQVEGVDEADLVKNDGSYIYLATGKSLQIVRGDNAKVVSVTTLPGHARQLFVSGDRVVAYVTSAPKQRECSYGYDCEVSGDGSSTDVIVLDVSNRATPRTVRTLKLSGSLIAARKIGRAVHTVVADHDAQGPSYETEVPDLPWCGVSAKTRTAMRARFERLKVKNERAILAAATLYPTIAEGSAPAKKLCDVLRPALADGEAFTTLVSFDLEADQEPPVTATIQSRPGTVFASEQGLYVSVRHDSRESNGRYAFFSGESEVSDLHKFRIGATPGATRYVGSGVIPGHVIDQFAMDEWGGVLRVATSRGRVPDPKVESSISMLIESKQGNLLRVGAVEHIAPGEDIRAVRFDDDRGYVVTFKKTDPLFVLDLKNPTAPAVLGELKIPGFSTYLHRLDATHLLSIGYDADDHGSFAYFGGLLLQLFDVTDPLQPKLLHRAKIGSRGSSSEAVANHLAFNFMRDRNLLAIPATVCTGGGDGRAGDTLAFSGLVLFDTTIEHGFRKLGGIDHGTVGASCNAWWSNASSQVKRSVILDDRVFSIASDRMKMQSLKHLGEDVASVSLAQ